MKDSIITPDTERYIKYCSTSSAACCASNTEKPRITYWCNMSIDGKLRPNMCHSRGWEIASNKRWNTKHFIKKKAKIYRLNPSLLFIFPSLTNSKSDPTGTQSHNNLIIHGALSRARAIKRFNSKRPKITY